MGMEILHEINKIQNYLHSHSNVETIALPEVNESDLSENEGCNEKLEQMSLKKIQKTNAVIITLPKKKSKTTSKNDLFWNKYRKVPFIFLAMLMSTFLILIFAHFTNLYFLLFDGLLPSLLSLTMLLPIYCLFKKYDVSLKHKSLCIQKQIEKENTLRDEKSQIVDKNKELLKENEHLANNLLTRYNQIQAQKKKIIDLKQIVAQRKSGKKMWFARRISQRTNGRAIGARRCQRF